MLYHHHHHQVTNFLFIKPLKPSRYVPRTWFKMPKLWILPTECTYALRMGLTINSLYLCKRHYRNALCNTDCVFCEVRTRICRTIQFRSICCLIVWSTYFRKNSNNWNVQNFWTIFLRHRPKWWEWEYTKREKWKKWKWSRFRGGGT